jgi:arylsulfatase A-like enzyme/tetratricopeptide (TPR) repeat protein
MVATGNKQTSILLITLDTTRADRLEPYGATGVETPALAGLAARGVVFEQAMAVAPVTAPTHATILTGLYPPSHGVRDNAIHALAEDIPTFAESLSVAGFRTAAFISSAVLERRFGLAQGFELYDDNFAVSGSRTESRMMIERPASATVDRALRWLDSLGESERYFVWVHLFDPHAPYAPPKPWSDRFPERPYDGEIAFMDAEIGRLLRHPRASGREVVVAAIGDHGESLGDHGEMTHGLLVYESTIRVPWIMSWPGCPTGARFDQPVSQVDFMPTALDVLALPGVDDGVDGKSLIPLIDGNQDGPDRLLYAESLVGFFSYGWSRLHTVRDGRLKYINGPVAELYDLSDDPGEKDNLADGRTGDVQRLRAALEVMASDAGEESFRPAGETGSIEKLRALGYVVGDANRPIETARGNPMELIGIHEEIQRSSTLLEAARYAEAILVLEGVLDLDPNNIAALQNLTRGLVGVRRLEEAERVAEKARLLAPWSARAPMVQAEVALQRGDTERALELADESLVIDPNHQEGRIERARFLAMLGRNAEAVEELERVRQQSGNSAWIDLRYAEYVDVPEGNLDQAEKRLRSALARDPFLSDGWILLGTVLESQNRQLEAEAAFRSGLEHRPGHPELRSRLATALANRGRIGEAEAIWRELVRTDPGFARAWHNLASVAIQRGDWAEVERLARTAVARDPGMSEAWNNLGIGLEELGRTGEAEAAYGRAIETGDPDQRALFNLGLLLRESRRYTEAAEVQRQVLARQPSNAAANFELGAILVGPLGDIERGKLHLQAVIAADPDGPRARQARAILDRLP